MDVATSSIGLFANAFKAYQIIARAIEIGSQRLIWDALMRIERARFEIWGRTLGFLDAKTGELKEIEATNQPKRIAELDAMVGGEEMQKLVFKILVSIAKVLQDFDKSARRYRIGGDDQPSAAVNVEDTPELEELAKQPKARWRRNWKRGWDSTKDFTMHVILAVKDETMIKDLLKELRDLNDGLEKLLSLSQRSQVAKALSSGVLSDYQTAEELTNFLGVGSKLTIEADYDSVDTATRAFDRHQMLLTTARVKRCCIGMPAPKYVDGEKRDDKPRLIAEANNHAAYNVKDYEVAIEKVDIRQVPRITDNEKLWPNGMATITTESNPAIHVLVEWRQPHAVSPGFSIPEPELHLRRNLLVQLLHETSSLVQTEDYRTLDCLGFIRSEGRVDGKPFPLIGFLTKIPDWSSTELQPVTLNKLLKDSFEGEDNSGIPSLDARFRLARQLSRALYQLQCSQWLHRNLSSHQVVFFEDKISNKLRLEEPFLIGLQYSRPDDQSAIDKGAYWRTEHHAPYMVTWGSLGLYLHPDFTHVKQRRYQRSDDVYSLGVILLEVAFWEPASAFLQEGNDIAATAGKILESAKTELAAEVGETYQKAVIKCLQGLRGAIRKQWLKPTKEEAEEQELYDGSYKGEDPEFGLEEDLLWNVVREIEKCVV
ncbi:hypothetical protein G7054_g6203 [Neopestalotiopsis clavispora]|nr:hypothetical protein G7054_g6203 [Neopestalotiopsis clavispora]